MGRAGLMRDGDRASEALAVSLALVLGLLAALPLFSPVGIVSTRAGGDSPFLLQRVQQMSLALADGAVPVRWMADANLGLGYPAYSYYAALPYYLAAVLHLAGLGIITAIQVTQALGFAVGGLSAYGLARRLALSRPAALLASASFTLAPFHLVNVYVRGDSLSEFWAMGLFALCLFSTLRLRDRRGPGDIVLLAVSYAALVVSHNITALLASPVLALTVLIVGWCAPRRRETLGAGAAALGLGLLLCVWFWYPALAESGLVQLNQQTTGYFDFRGHFRGVDLVQRRLIHDYRIGGGSDPFSMGLVQALLILPGLGTVLRRALQGRQDRQLWLGLAAVLLLVTLLITPLSEWLWRHLPLLPYAQFPWRFLGLQAVLAAPMVGLTVSAVKPRRQWLLSGALIALVGLAGLGGLRPDRMPLTEADVTSERLMLFEAFSGNVGGTVRAEYLPAGVIPRYYTSPQLLDRNPSPGPWSLSAGLREAVLVTKDSSHQLWQIEMAEDDQIIFATLFFPGWTAKVDEATQPLRAVDGLGLMSLDLDAGSHVVQLDFEPTRIRRCSELLSMGGGLVLIGLLIWWAWRSKRRALTLGLALVCCGGVLVLVWLGPLSPPSGEQLEGPLVMDLSSYPYLHHEPGGLLLGDAVLGGYRYGRDTLSPGQDLVIDLEWQSIAPEQILHLRLMPISASATDQNVVWGEIYQPIDVETMRLTLQLPDDIPPGVYVPRVGIKDEDEGTLEITTQRGSPQSRTSLAPVWISRDSMRRLDLTPVALFGPARAPAELALLSVKTTPIKDTRVEVDMDWRAERVCERNYAISVRHLSAQGEVLRTEDLAPMSPNYPTGLWRAAEVVRVRMLLPIGEARFSPGDAWEIVLYDRGTLAEIGSVVVPVIWED